jgi:plastocyanin
MVSRVTLFGFALAALLLTGTAEAGEHVVVQKNTAFYPGEITIKPGDAVVFKNEDGVVHNVFSVTKGVEFNLNIQQPGQSSSFTFPNEGRVEVRCVIHPAMKLVINVKK